MARSQAQDVIRCQYCEDEPAVFHCVLCGDELCPRCKVFHLKSKVPSGHNIIRLSERLHLTNLVKMCEIHSSKAYEACCEDCQVPVCITCIQEVHNKHSIGKIQDLYEKQKTETEDESRDESLQSTQPTWSVSKTISTKNVLGRSVRISEMKTKKEQLYYVSCRDDRSAYVSGFGPGILLIDRSGTQLDNISTDNVPQGLAVMKDGSLIYSDSRDYVIYRVSLNKQKTKLINTEYYPGGLCCTRSGDILVCMGLLDKARVVKYSSSGRKIQEFMTDQNGMRLFISPFFVCENVNGDICVTDSGILYSNENKVVVLNNSGNPRFTYDGNIPARTLKEEFEPCGVATDSLGHILIADRPNNAVHLISQDGDFLSYILTKDDGISLPRGISVDRSDNLWLVEIKTACVKVYQYLS